MLTRLSVTGYKLFRGADFHFGPLTVVVGGNGAGKTALWEVLSLSPSIYRGDGSDENLDRIFRVASGQGFSGIKLWGAVSSGPVLSLYLDDFDYTVAFDGTGLPGLERADTRVETLNRNGQSIIDLSSLSEGLKHYLVRDASPISISGGPPPPPGTAFLVDYRFRTPLALNRSRVLGADAESFRARLSTFRGLRGYSPRPIGRDYSELQLDTPGDHLRWDGRNVAQVLLKLKVEDEDKYGEIRDIFHAVALRNSLRLHVSMGERLIQISLRDEFGNQLWLQDWPDGWKAFLLLLVALRMAKPNGLLFIEEPENHLHPRLIEAFFDQVLLANKRGTQVILATHSMELVNHVDDARQLVLLDQGTPHRPSDDLAEAIAESGVLLGTAWRTGSLEEPTQ